MRNGNIRVFRAGSALPVSNTLSLAFLFSLVQKAVAGNLRKLGEGSGSNATDNYVAIGVSVFLVVALVVFCAVVGGCRIREGHSCDCKGVS